MIGFPLLNTPPIDVQTGQWTRPWALFFQAMWKAQFVDGGDFSIDGIENDVTGLDAAVAGLQRASGDVAALLQLIPDDSRRPSQADQLSTEFSLLQNEDGLNARRPQLDQLALDVAVILHEAQDALAKATRALQDVLVEQATPTDVIRSMASQDAGNVKITGGSISGVSIGSSGAGAGSFTTISASGQITSTLATGTAPFSIASTTVVPNLNVSQLLGNTWAAPAAIGSTTPAAGTFTSLTVTTGLAAFNKGASVNGPATLGATGTTQWSFETPVMRYYIGDGTGYSLRFTKRTGSTNTDLFTFTDGGAATISGAFGCNGKTAQTSFALGAAATDLASVITLANNLRTMSINNGMGS
jgi:hypothetical protein